MKSLITILFLIFNGFTYSQWMHYDTLGLHAKIKELKLNEPNNFFYSRDGSICSCDLLFKMDDTTHYIVEYFFQKDYPNLLFFHLTMKNSKEIYGSFIKSVKECSGDKMQCWVEEFIWYYLDENKKLEKTEFYDQGVKYAGK